MDKHIKILYGLIFSLIIYIIYKNKSLEKMTSTTDIVSQENLLAIKNLGLLAGSMISQDGGTLTLPYNLNVTGNISASGKINGSLGINNDRTNYNPSVYRSRGMGIYNEFKNFSGWGLCQTVVPWVDTSGGSIYQIFTKYGQQIKRTANEDNNTWNNWVSPIDGVIIKPSKIEATGNISASGKIDAGNSSGNVVTYDSTFYLYNKHHGNSAIYTRIGNSDKQDLGVRNGHNNANGFKWVIKKNFQ